MHAKGQDRALSKKTMQSRYFITDGRSRKSDPTLDEISGPIGDILRVNISLRVLRTADVMAHLKLFQDRCDSRTG